MKINPEIMNKKTLSFLSCLKDNSREKLTTISKKTNIPISTLFDMLKELNEKIIIKNTVLLNFVQLGFDTRAQVILKVSREHKDRLRKHLECNGSVNTVYKVNSGWDFVIETIHRSIKELDNFLENLDQNFNVEDKEIHYVVDEVKREGFTII